MATVQSEVVLLVRDPITLQSTGVYAGSSVDVEVLLSNWTIGGYPSWSKLPIQLTWKVAQSTDDEAFVNGTQPLVLGMVPQGETQSIANLSVPIPTELGGAAIVVLETVLQVGRTRIATNSW